VDVGQEDDFSKIEERAYKAGAVQHFYIDAKREFADVYISRAVLMNGMYEGVYPLGTALARPLIAEKVVEVARRVGADAVAHGSTSKGNDQVRFDVTVKALAPDLKLIAPARSGV
jgi:argininosuccinate synthase